jgi:GT2 family glycosyltransferase
MNSNLGIAIPTFNRKEQLKECLNSFMLRVIEMAETKYAL